MDDQKRKKLLEYLDALEELVPNQHQRDIVHRAMEVLLNYVLAPPSQDEEAALARLWEAFPQFHANGILDHGTTKYMVHPEHL